MSTLLDTNIAFELLRPSLDPAVERWDGHCPTTDLYFSSIGEAELRYGVALLPGGRRRDALAQAIEAILREEFDDRILPFDSAAGRRAAGRAILPADCQMAAIARSRDMTVATRNLRDFEGAGV